MTEAKSELLPCQNTDKEIWREIPGDYYSASIHVTAQNQIGIDVGGLVIVMGARDWHKLAQLNQSNSTPLESFCIALPLLFITAIWSLEWAKQNPRRDHRPACNAH